jgi:hypothetical protein
MEMNQAAIEANKRLTMERDIWRAGQPTRDMHDTLKEIQELLAEVLEILRKNNNS